MEKQKYQVGDWVSVEYIGEVIACEKLDDLLVYTIVEPSALAGKRTISYSVKESYLYPLPTPLEKEELDADNTNKY